MRGSARIYDVRMAQFVLKMETLSHILGACGSQNLRSSFPIMALDNIQNAAISMTINALLENKNKTVSFNETFRRFRHTSPEVNVKIVDVVLFLFSNNAFYCHPYLSSLSYVISAH